MLHNSNDADSGNNGNSNTHSFLPPTPEWRRRAQESLGAPQLRQGSRGGARLPSVDVSNSGSALPATGAPRLSTTTAASSSSPSPSGRELSIGSPLSVNGRAPTMTPDTAEALRPTTHKARRGKGPSFIMKYGQRHHRGKAVQNENGARPQDGAAATTFSNSNMSTGAGRGGEKPKAQSVPRPPQRMPSLTPPKQGEEEEPPHQHGQAKKESVRSSSLPSPIVRRPTSPPDALPLSGTTQGGHQQQQQQHRAQEPKNESKRASQSLSQTEREAEKGRSSDTADKGSTHGVASARSSSSNGPTPTSDTEDDSASATKTSTAPPPAVSRGGRMLPATSSIVAVPPGPGASAAARPQSGGGERSGGGLPTVVAVPPDISGHVTSNNNNNNNNGNGASPPSSLGGRRVNSAVRFFEETIDGIDKDGEHPREGLAYGYSMGNHNNNNSDNRNVSSNNSETSSGVNVFETDADGFFVYPHAIYSHSLRELYRQRCEQLSIRPNKTVLARLPAGKGASPADTLDLGTTFLGANGCLALAAVLGFCPALRVVNLRGVGLEGSRQGTESVLRALRGCPCLRRLDVSGNRLNEQSGRWLLLLAQSVGSLRELEMSGSGVSSALAARIEGVLAQRRALDAQDGENTAGGDGGIGDDQRGNSHVRGAEGTGAAAIIDMQTPVQLRKLSDTDGGQGAGLSRGGGREECATSPHKLLPRLCHDNSAGNGDAINLSKNKRALPSALSPSSTHPVRGPGHDATPRLSPIAAPHTGIVGSPATADALRPPQGRYGSLTPIGGAPIPSPPPVPPTVGDGSSTHRRASKSPENGVGTMGGEEEGEEEAEQKKRVPPFVALALAELRRRLHRNRRCIQHVYECFVFPAEVEAQYKMGRRAHHAGGGGGANSGSSGAASPASSSAISGGGGAGNGSPGGAAATTTTTTAVAQSEEVERIIGRNTRGGVYSAEDAQRLVHLELLGDKFSLENLAQIQEGNCSWRAFFRALRLLGVHSASADLTTAVRFASYCGVLSTSTVQFGKLLNFLRSHAVILDGRTSKSGGVLTGADVLDRLEARQKATAVYDFSPSSGSALRLAAAASFSIGNSNSAVVGPAAAFATGAAGANALASPSYGGSHSLRRRSGNFGSFGESLQELLPLSVGSRLSVRIPSLILGSFNDLSVLEDSTVNASSQNQGTLPPPLGGGFAGFASPEPLSSVARGRSNNNNNSNTRRVSSVSVDDTCNLYGSYKATPAAALGPLMSTGAAPGVTGSVLGASMLSVLPAAIFTRKRSITWRAGERLQVLESDGLNAAVSAAEVQFVIDRLYDYRHLLRRFLRQADTTRGADGADGSGSDGDDGEERLARLSEAARRTSAKAAGALLLQGSTFTAEDAEWLPGTAGGGGGGKRGSHPQGRLPSLMNAWETTAPEPVTLVSGRASASTNGPRGSVSASGGSIPGHDLNGTVAGVRQEGVEEGNRQETANAPDDTGSQKNDDDDESLFSVARRRCQWPEMRLALPGSGDGAAGSAAGSSIPDDSSRGGGGGGGGGGAAAVNGNNNNNNNNSPGSLISYSHRTGSSVGGLLPSRQVYASPAPPPSTQRERSGTIPPSQHRRLQKEEQEKNKQQSGGGGGEKEKAKEGSGSSDGGGAHMVPLGTLFNFCVAIAGESRRGTVLAVLEACGVPLGGLGDYSAIVNHANGGDASGSDTMVDYEHQLLRRLALSTRQTADMPLQTEQEYWQKISVGTLQRTLAPF